MSLRFDRGIASQAICHFGSKRNNFMRLSEVGWELIKRCEGFRSHIYKDVAGFTTIGYGHRITPPELFPEGIEEGKAVELLAADVRQAEHAVERLVRVPLSQGQFDALVDFCFNLGAGRLAGSTLLRELNASRYSAAADQLLAWDHAGGEVNVGLKARRQAEFELWMNPIVKPALDAA
jgi:lysozyme